MTTGRPHDHSRRSSAGRAAAETPEAVQVPGPETPSSPSGYEGWVRARLARLRADFPDHGFLVIDHGWYAVRGRGAIIVAAGPDELRRALPSRRSS